MNILVVAALKDELEGHFDDIDVLYTGVGKINATYAITKAIVKDPPDVIINFGSAGSRHIPKGTLVNCQRFIQRDMDCIGLGVPLGITPFDQTPGLLGHVQETYNFNLPSVACYTGDRFLNYFQCSEFGQSVVDMEAYALAKVAYLNQIQFMCFKYVTDGTGVHSKKDWETHLREGASYFREIYDTLRK